MHNYMYLVKPDISKSLWEQEKRGLSSPKTSKNNQTLEDNLKLSPAFMATEALSAGSWTSWCPSGLPDPFLQRCFPTGHLFLPALYHTSEETVWRSLEPHFWGINHSYRIVRQNCLASIHHNWHSIILIPNLVPLWQYSSYKGTTQVKAQLEEEGIPNALPETERSKAVVAQSSASSVKSL